MNNNYNNSSKKFSIGKIFKMFLTYIKNIFFDFFTSFKYNNMKLPALLIAAPGIFLGFFIAFHAPTINQLSFMYYEKISDNNAVIELNDETADIGDWKITIKDYAYKTSSGEDAVTDVELVNLDKYEVTNDAEDTRAKLPKISLTRASFTLGGQELAGNKIDVNKQMAITFAEPDEDTAGNESYSIASFTLYIYRTSRVSVPQANGTYKDTSIDYLVETITDLQNGQSFDISMLGGNSYKFAIQLIASPNDTQNKNSDISNLFTLNSEYTGINYEGDTFFEFAGRYELKEDVVVGDEVVFSKDDNDFIYDVTAKGSDSKLIVNGKEIPASFTMNKNATTTTLGASSEFKVSSQREVNIIPFDYTGMVLFILMLLGILNIFTALSVSGKKNLGSVLKATVSTIAMLLCAVLYVYAIFACSNAVDDGKIVLEVASIWSTNTYISVISVILSVVCSLLGVVLGFIFYDRTYEKVDR